MKKITEHGIFMSEKNEALSDLCGHDVSILNGTLVTGGFITESRSGVEVYKIDALGNRTPVVYQWDGTKIVFDESFVLADGESVSIEYENMSIDL